MSESWLFIAKVTVLLTPFIGWFGLPGLVIWASGEFSRPAAVAIRQANAEKEIHFGLAYSNRTQVYKWESLKLREPEVLALGTSRVMGFRKECFRQPANFYNCGGLAIGLRDYHLVVESLPITRSRRTIILGLDQWQFNDGFVASEHGWRAEDAGASDELAMLQRFSGDVFRKLRDGRIQPSEFFKNALSRRFVGLAAVADCSGFRNDGSYDYGKAAIGSSFWRDTVSRVATQGLRFESGVSVSRKRVQEVDDLLSLCRSRGIHAAAFLPPYASTVYREMSKRRQTLAYVFELRDALDPIFRKHGFTLTDSTQARLLGATDREMIDGYHGGDSVYARILLRMAKADPIVRSLVDMDEVARQIAHPTEANPPPEDLHP